MLADNVKLQYICMLLCGEALRQFDAFCSQVGSTDISHLNLVIFGLGMHYFPVHFFSQKRRVIRRGMRNPNGLKVRCFTARLIGLNEYIAAFPGENSSDKIGETDLNEILLNSISNGWINQAYVQGFGCETITLVLKLLFKKNVLLYLNA